MNRKGTSLARLAGTQRNRHILAVVRPTRILSGLLLAAAILLVVPAAFAQSEVDAIVVVEVGDPLDQRMLDYIVEALGEPNVHAFVLKIDSPGVSSGDLEPVFQAVATAAAPVVAWIGPNPAVAFGGSAYLANHADIRSAAPGVEVGFLQPAVVRSGAVTPTVRPGSDPDAFRATVAALSNSTVVVSEESTPIVGFVDRVDPALGQLIVALDGTVVERADQSFTLSTAEARTIGDQTVLVASRPVRFVKDGLLDRFLRLGSRPETAFLFLIFAMAFAVFEFYAAGSGLMAFVASLAMVPAGYGLATLPMWWPSMGLIVGGMWLLVWGFVQNRVDWRAILGSGALVMGGLLFTSTRPMYPPAAWLVIVASATVILFVWYTLTTVVRGRFATPTVGRESMLGRRCVVVEDLDPIGVVLVDDVRWRASADRGVQIQAGAPAEVVGLTGLLLDVDPVVATPPRPS